MADPEIIEPAALAAPQVAVTETPEFKAALALAVEAATKTATESILAQLQGAMATAPVSASTDTDALFQKMALAIADISDQGTNRKRVAPEILARRAAEAQRMDDLLKKAYDEGVLPAYTLVAKVYLNETFIEPYQPGKGNRAGEMIPTEIDWAGPPNMAMRPLNDAAKEIYDAFLGSIGSAADMPGTAPAQYWTTNRGLIVKGRAPVTPQAKAISQNEDTLLVRGGTSNPMAPAINVLGTIAKPAIRQNYERAV